LSAVLLLAIDTSTPCVGVAVCRDGDVLAERRRLDPRRHNEVLAVGIRECLAAADLTPGQLDRIAVGVGPGPYTGLRVGVITARSLGHALGIGVHGVCSLDVLARAVGDELRGEFLVVTDARRREVYWARYADGLRIDGPGVARPDVLTARCPVIGEGGLLYPSAFPAARGPHHPAPADLARLVHGRLAAGEPTLPAIPLYLRRPDAVEPGTRKPVDRVPAQP